jgi:probable F420-dependent oxidoreductase
MRFALELPTTAVDAPEEFLTGAAIAEMARHAESLGFEAVYVTDHPAGDQQWLDTGGHHALDPFVALSFAAAATTTLRVQTHILVLPYRNPFLTAKNVLSLDVLSGGRLTLGVAAGYLRSEFNALGVDYDERNELFDEALEVLKLALAHDAVAYTGRHFRSRGTTMRPRPVQQPHPPIWIGGNSRRALRRAVESAQGWCPFPNPAATSPALKTPQLDTLDALAARLDEARAYAEEIGRSEPLDVCFAPLGLSSLGQDLDRRAMRDEVEALEALGVTQTPVAARARTRDEWRARAEQLADDLIA